MGDKIKPRQIAKPRNHMVKDMFLIQGAKGGPMRDRRERRPKDHRNTKIEDFEDDWDEEDSPA